LFEFRRVVCAVRLFCLTGRTAFAMTGALFCLAPAGCRPTLRTGPPTGRRTTGGLLCSNRATGTIRHWRFEVFARWVTFNTQGYCFVFLSSSLAIRAFISAISLTWALMMPSASSRTRGSVMVARREVRMAMEWWGIMARM
jgi:hypothetical protein